MRSVVMAALLVFGLGAPGFAQAPAAPAQAPAQPAPAPAVAPAPAPAPFPAGAKIGIVNLQQIASLSAEGKASTTRVQALITKKQNEAAAKAKQLQDNQNRLQQSGTLMNEAARAQLEKDVERLTLEAVKRFDAAAPARPAAAPSAPAPAVRPAPTTTTPAPAPRPAAPAAPRQ